MPKPVIGSREWAEGKSPEDLKQDLRDFLKSALDEDGTIRPTYDRYTDDLAIWFISWLEARCAFTKTSAVLRWRERECIVRMYGGHQSLEEIARIVKIAPENVSREISRGLGKLVNEMLGIVCDEGVLDELAENQHQEHQEHQDRQDRQEYH